MHSLHEIFPLRFFASPMMMFFEKFEVYDEEDVQKHNISKLIKQEKSNKYIHIYKQLNNNALLT